MDPLGYQAGDANLYRYVFNNAATLTDPMGQCVFAVVDTVACIAAAVALVSKVVDYGLTIYDLYQAKQTLEDPCSTPEEVLLALLNIVLAGAFELIEPDDLLPVGIPADDVARRLVMRQARKALQEEGVDGFVRVIKDQLGDHADDVLRQLDLDDYVDDVAGKADDVVDAGDNIVEAVIRTCANSFSYDTLVSTPYGFAAISELDVGEYVLAFDEATGTLIYASILATWVHHDPVIVHLTIDGELIETTPEHPFKLASGEWVFAKALQIGDQIQKANQTTGTVNEVTFIYDAQAMYNLTVATAHTFFVGEGQWLVHNDFCKWQFPNPGKANQAASRGWNNTDIQNILDSPALTGENINKATGNSATYYYRPDGHYVVRDDVTGDIFHVSNTHDPNWIDPNTNQPIKPIP